MPLICQIFAISLRWEAADASLTLYSRRPELFPKRIINQRTRRSDGKTILLDFWNSFSPNFVATSHGIGMEKTLEQQVCSAFVPNTNGCCQMSISEHLVKTISWPSLHQTLHMAATIFGTRISKSILLVNTREVHYVRCFENNVVMAAIKLIDSRAAISVSWEDRRGMLEASSLSSLPLSRGIFEIGVHFN